MDNIPLGPPAFPGNAVPVIPMPENVAATQVSYSGVLETLIEAVLAPLGVSAGREIVARIALEVFAQLPEGNLKWAMMNAAVSGMPILNLAISGYQYFCIATMIYDTYVKLRDNGEIPGVPGKPKKRRKQKSRQCCPGCGHPGIQSNSFSARPPLADSASPQPISTGGTLLQNNSLLPQNVAGMFAAGGNQVMSAIVSPHRAQPARKSQSATSIRQNGASNQNWFNVVMSRMGWGNVVPVNRTATGSVQDQNAPRDTPANFRRQRANANAQQAPCDNLAEAVVNAAVAEHRSRNLVTTNSSSGSNATLGNAFLFKTAAGNKIPVNPVDFATFYRRKMGQDNYQKLVDSIVSKSIQRRSKSRSLSASSNSNAVSSKAGPNGKAVNRPSNVARDVAMLNEARVVAGTDFHYRNQFVSPWRDMLITIDLIPRRHCPHMPRVTSPTNRPAAGTDTHLQMPRQVYPGQWIGQAHEVFQGSRDCFASGKPIKSALKSPHRSAMDMRTCSIYGPISPVKSVKFHPSAKKACY